MRLKPYGKARKRVQTKAFRSPRAFNVPVEKNAGAARDRLRGGQEYRGRTLLPWKKEFGWDQWFAWQGFEEK